MRLSSPGVCDAAAAAISARHLNAVRGVGGAAAAVGSDSNNAAGSRSEPDSFSSIYYMHAFTDIPLLLRGGSRIILALFPKCPTNCNRGGRNYEADSTRNQLMR